MNNIIFFDMDSTLIAGEGLDALAAHKQLSDKIFPITQATMDGTMPFADAFYQKICTLAPSLSDIARLAQRYSMHQDPDIFAVFSHLRDRHWEIGILSHTFGAGIRDFLLQHHIAMDHVYTNALVRDREGNFVSVDRDQPMMHGDGKKNIVAAYKKQGYTKVVMVGDSVGDMKTQGVADSFIGYGKYCIRPLVQQQAQHFVLDLHAVLGKLED